MSNYNLYYRPQTKKDQMRTGGTSMIITGIIMLFSGFMTTIFLLNFGVLKFMGAILFIGPIALFCAGIGLLSFGIYLFKKASKMPEEKPKEQILHISVPQINSKPQKENFSTLTCPACGAPLEGKPPCKCTYCGRFIDKNQ